MRNRNLTLCFHRLTVRTAILCLCAIEACILAGCTKESPRKTEHRKAANQSAPAHRSAPPRKGPRLAIIIDDIGNDRTDDEAVLRLPGPLTVSVLPHLPLSTEIADEAARRGDEVMLHLPMQPDSEASPSETIELRPGMPSAEVRTAFAAMLATVPHALGVNNHEGSRATADPRLMSALMPLLKQRGLFFVDSRTSPSTVAYDAARRYGVPAASRKVFLDDSVNKNAIEKQIDLAVHDADRGGEAIAIGHPHPETIVALRDMLPRLKERGVQLVFASDLVR